MCLSQLFWGLKAVYHALARLTARRGTVRHSTQVLMDKRMEICTVALSAGLSPI